MSGKSRCTQQPQAAEGASSGAPAHALHSPLPPAHSTDVNAYDALRLGLNRAVAVAQAMGGMVHQPRALTRYCATRPRVAATRMATP